MFKKLKLGTKIISLLIILVLLSVSVVGFMAVIEETSIIKGNLTYTTNELSLGLSQKIESYINNNVSVLETLGVTNDIISYNIDGQKRVLKKVNGDNKQFALLFVTDTVGQQVSRSDDGDVVNQALLKS
jgi:methyl-accepting chemotaxis protein